MKKEKVNKYVKEKERKNYFEERQNKVKDDKN